MPSRNAYDHLSIDGNRCSRPLDVYNRRDVQDILLAVQLNRIILRALEIEAYGALQRSINELPKQKDDAAIELLNDRLGRLLCSLRWRMAWWASFGHQNTIAEDSWISFTDRVTTLTHVLYCYFFITKKKTTSLRSGAMEHAQSPYDYPSSSSTSLPNDDSLAGFNAWMQRGRDLLQQATG